jgi:uncharacterized protein YraI
MNHTIRLNSLTSWLLVVLAALTGCRPSLSHDNLINTMVAGTMAALPAPTATRIPPTPTFLPVPTLVPPTPGSNIPAVTTRQRVAVRSGPGDLYPSYGWAPVGTSAEVVGVSQDGGWWAIKIPASYIPTGLAWVPAQYVETANTKAVPVLPASPMQPYVTPIPPPVNGPTVVAIDALVVRSGPSLEYIPYGVILAGTSLQAIGVSPDGKWWQVGLPAEVDGSGQGWAPAYSVQAYHAGNVPVVEPPPPEPILQPPPPTDNKAAFVVMTAPQAVRAGPGREYRSYGVAPMGMTAILLGTSPDEQWYAISIPPGASASQQGWVKAVNCQVYNADELPVILPPARP